MKKIGYLVSQELLDSLDELYPDQCPRPSMSDREIWMATGNRQVVDFLLSEFQLANQNILEE